MREGEQAVVESQPDCKVERPEASATPVWFGVIGGQVGLVGMGMEKVPGVLASMGPELSFESATACSRRCACRLGNPWPELAAYASVDLPTLTHQMHSHVPYGGWV